MTPRPTPSGPTPPGTGACPGGDLLPAAGAFVPPTDFHPDSRAAQLFWAQATFAALGSHPDATLRRACRLIMDLSRDHALRQRAQDLMIFLEA